MKALQNSVVVVIILLLVYSPAFCGEQEQAMDIIAEMVSKCDIGYKISFRDSEAMPFRIDILIHRKNWNKAINSFRTAPLENINDNLAKNSRVYFVWRDENNKKSAVWSFAERDGKIRIHDRKEKRGYWIDLGVFLKSVAEMSDDEKKVLRENL